MQPSPSGSITIPPLSSCSRMCLSERTTARSLFIACCPPGLLRGQPLKVSGGYADTASEDVGAADNDRTSASQALRLESELGRPRDGHGGPAARPRSRRDLPSAPAARGDLVYPTRLGAGRARALARALCAAPSASGAAAASTTRTLVDRFDEALDDGTQAVLDDLELLTRANMQEQIERFVAAIDADLILPEDF